MKLRYLAALMLVFASLTGAQEQVDLEVIHRIKAEAFERSQVMIPLFYLTEVNGPRLTGSPAYRAAADWTVKKLGEWGIAGARLEPWGEFGRGWSYKRFVIHMIEPTAKPLSGVPLAWSSGTRGPVRAEVALAPLFPKADDPDSFDIEKLTAAIQNYVQKYRGKLKGKIVLIDPARDFTLPTEPASERYDEEKLAEIAKAPDPQALPPIEYPLTKLPAEEELRWLVLDNAGVEVEMEYWMRLEHATDELNRFLSGEGAVAVLSVDTRGKGAIIFAESAGSWEDEAPVPPPSISLLPEQYNRIVRLVEQKVPVTLEVELDATFYDSQEGINVIAEIPGGKKKDEVVLFGGHLDSWHAGTGAADNAAGCAVALEAMRILKKLDLPMDRTVRLALWDGEEQGYFGSRGYAKTHYGNAVTMKLEPAHGLLAAYFNMDNGTGKIRGIYLQENDRARPIFEAWLAPFADLGADTVSIRNTGGTDHLAFDALGLPAFQFIQDPLDYDTRTHHSNLDVFDHIQPSDLMQASAILASFVYQAAVRDEMLPRKPLPESIPRREPGDSEGASNERNAPDLTNLSEK